MPLAKDFEYTISDLKERSAKYLDACKENGKMATFPGLAIALDIPRNRLAFLYALSNTYTSSHPSKRIEMRKELKDNGEDIQWEHLLEVQRVITQIQDGMEQRKDTPGLFLLKQAEYGGYSDGKNTGSASGEVTVNVKLSGMGKHDPAG